MVDRQAECGVPSALIDLDIAPAADIRPGRSRPRPPGRSALVMLSLILVALLGPAAPSVPDHLPARLISARNEDNVFVSGDRFRRKILLLGAGRARCG